MSRMIQMWVLSKVGVLLFAASCWWGTAVAAVEPVENQPPDAAAALPPVRVRALRYFIRATTEWEVLYGTWPSRMYWEANTT